MSNKNHQEYVVQYNTTTDLYLIFYDADPERCQWGSLNQALTYSTLIEAQNLAASIGGGTVGTPKP